MRPQALIVEDDHATSVLLQQVVRSAELEPIYVEDGSDALQILMETTPLVVILDILLPHVNGIEVLQFIEQTPRLDHTFVIVVSSHDSADHGWVTPRANFYYVKPVRVKELREILQMAIQRVS
jgi:DNA-binding response OmpR family regulator